MFSQIYNQFILQEIPYAPKYFDSENLLNPKK